MAAASDIETLYAKYVAQYRKNYLTTEEYETRMSIFAKKQSLRVQAIRGDQAAIEFRGFPPKSRDDLVKALGKDITVRLAGHAVADGEPRRVDGKLVAADETTATVLTESGDERTIDIDAVDKARTVFEWGPKPKPGKGPGNTKHKKTAQPTDRSPQPKTTNKEKQKS